MQRGAIAATCVVLGSCGALALAASRGSPTYSACRYDHRAPLPADIHGSYSHVIAHAERVLRHVAHSDRTSGLPQLLAGSTYRETEIGPFRNDDGPGYRRRFRLIGATVLIAIDQPHPAEAIVPVADRAWPRTSPYFRYSRHLGYVSYRARFRSADLQDLALVVDVRRKRVVSIDPGPNSGGSVDPLPDGCPRPPQPDED